MKYIQKRTACCLIIGIFFLLIFSRHGCSDYFSQMENVQKSIKDTSEILKLKSEKLLKRQEETEKILTALLEFSRSSIQKTLLFSSPQEYIRISLLLESLAQRGEESLLDLNQEIAELNVIIELKKEQERELLQTCL